MKVGVCILCGCLYYPQAIICSNSLIAIVTALQDLFLMGLHESSIIEDILPLSIIIVYITIIINIIINIIAMQSKNSHQQLSNLGQIYFVTKSQFTKTMNVSQSQEFRLVPVNSPCHECFCLLAGQLQASLVESVSPKLS